MDIIKFIEQFTGMNCEQIIKESGKINLTKEEKKVYTSIVDAIEDGKCLTFPEQNRVAQRVFGYLIVNESKELNEQNNENR